MTTLRRGALAGLAAGACSGIFHLLLSETVLSAAIALEPSDGSVPLVSRGMQHVGLVAGTMLYGLAIGIVFALVFVRLRAPDAWSGSLGLAAVAFVAFWLVPFVKYPANPPGVGDPDTITARTAGYLVAIAISVGAAALAWQASRRLVARGVPAHVRQPAVVLGYVVVVGVVLAVLPAAESPGSVPASIIWAMRIDAAGGQLLFWAVLGAVFGALSARVQARSAALAAA